MPGLGGVKRPSEEGQQMRPERQIGNSIRVGWASEAHHLTFPTFSSFLYWAVVGKKCSHAWERHGLKASGTKGETNE